MSKFIPRLKGCWRLPILLFVTAFLLSAGFFIFVREIKAGIPESSSPIKEVPADHVPVLLPAWFLYLIKPEVSLPIGMTIGGGFIWLIRNAYESNQQLSRAKFKEDVIFSINGEVVEHITPRIKELEAGTHTLDKRLEAMKSKQLEIFSMIAAVQADIHFIYLTREQFLEYVDVELSRVLTESLGTPCKVKFYKNHLYVNPNRRKYVKVEESDFAN